MDGLAIACVILLALLTATQILGLFLWFRATARREQQAEGLHSAIENLVDRMIEIESTAKNFGPAIERSTGEAAKRLIDAVAAVNALLLPLQDHGKQLREHGSSLGSIFEAITKGAEHNSSDARGLRALLENDARELKALLENLGTLASRQDSTGQNVVTCVGSLENRAASLGRELNTRLEKLDSHLTALRAELKQATQF